MVEIIGTTIRLTRGDTLLTTLTLTRGYAPTIDTAPQPGKIYFVYNSTQRSYVRFDGPAFMNGVTYYEPIPYVPAAGDSIRFALKSPKMTSGNKQYKDLEPLIIKQIPNDTLLLRLDPLDTKDRDFGDYKYDIEITYASGIVDTFINNADLKLLPEVH